MAYSIRLPAAPLKRQLRLTRAQQNMTWDQLAARLGITPRTLCRLLKARDISEPTADRMACRLGLHPLLIWPRHWERIVRASNGGPSRRESK